MGQVSDFISRNSVRLNVAVYKKLGEAFGSLVVWLTTSPKQTYFFRIEKESGYLSRQIKLNTNTKCIRLCNTFNKMLS